MSHHIHYSGGRIFHIDIDFQSYQKGPVFLLLYTLSYACQSGSCQPSTQAAHKSALPRILSCLPIKLSSIRSIYSDSCSSLCTTPNQSTRLRQAHRKGIGAFHLPVLCTYHYAIMSGFAPKSMKMRNKKGLALNSAPSAAPPASIPGDAPYSIPSAAQESTLEIAADFKLDLNEEDLVVIKDLGAGNGGSVSKVQHKVTKAIMARKVSSIPLHLDTPPLTSYLPRSSTSKPNQKYASALFVSSASCTSAIHLTSSHSTVPSWPRLVTSSCVWSTQT